ncbi:MAG: signal peptide peptidase SppA, partial [Rhodobacterales bacterium]|nr:signal peptide peptidase SppA [Rhodobacterales bacterium]
WTAREAVESGLVDGAIYPDELPGKLAEIYGGEVQRVRLLETPQAHSSWEAPAKIALIYIDGVIVDGESSSGGLMSGKRSGADTVVRALNQARLDPTVRAVVMRVDSPGGSFFASDEIWRAVSQTQDDQKPVVVSMGGLAASGGYYVSAGADIIFAEPGTLTGSIGAYSGKFSTDALFETIGIETTELTRGRNSTLYSTHQPWDDVQRDKIEDLVSESYQQFKTVVSDGRGLTMDEVEEVARGRVWTGQRAIENGLVDQIGGLQEAIAAARIEAGIPEGKKVGVISYSPQGKLLESLAPSLVGQVLGPLTGPLQHLLVPTQSTSDAATLIELLPVSDASWVHALYPNTQIWMMDPWLEHKTTP